MGAPHCDISRWPLVTVTMASTEMSEAEFSSYLDWMDALFSRAGKFAVLIDLRHAPNVPAKRRQIIGQRTKSIMDRNPGKLVGLGVVISSTVQRGIFTAILWITRSADTTRAFSDLNECEAWLQSQLRAAGAPTAPASERRRHSL